MDRTIHIGTRGSKLALWQAHWVQGELLKAHPTLTVEIIVIKTKGDKILDVPLAKVGGKGLFVKEIEDALLDGKIDLAVHSMKDMPAELPGGLTIGAIPQRENPQDVLVSKSGCLADLPEGAQRSPAFLLETQEGSAGHLQLDPGEFRGMVADDEAPREGIVQ